MSLPQWLSTMLPIDLTSYHLPQGPSPFVLSSPVASVATAHSLVRISAASVFFLSRVQGDLIFSFLNAL